MDLDTADDAPSIIQEIVFYDKPNLKSHNLNLSILHGQGDVVYTTSKKTSKTNAKFYKTQTTSPCPTDNGTVRKNDISFKLEQETIYIKSEMSMNDPEEAETQFEDVPEPVELVYNATEQGTDVPEPVEVACDSAEQPEVQSEYVMWFENSAEDAEQQPDSVERTEQVDIRIENQEESEDVQQVLENKEKGLRKDFGDDNASGCSFEIENGNEMVEQNQNDQESLEHPKQSSGAVENSGENSGCVEVTESDIDPSEDAEESPEDINKDVKQMKKDLDHAEGGLSGFKIKRGRGRPRKTDFPPHKGFHVISNRSKNEGNITEDDTEKRPRGRPKKKVETPTDGKRKKRGRPKKSDPENGYSDDEVSFKSPSKRARESIDKNEGSDELPKKRGAKQRIDGVTDKTRSARKLNELLEDTQKHVKAIDNVEEQLKTLFHGKNKDEKKGVASNRASSLRQTDRSSKGKTSTGEKKKAGSKPLPKKGSRQQKISDMFGKKIKVEPGVEQSEDPDPLELEDGYDSDADSRAEWMPEDYVEYKQKHLMKLLKRSVVCRICKMGFTSYYKMRKHKAVEHKESDGARTRKKIRAVKEDEKPEKIQGAGNPERDDSDSDADSRSEWMPEDYAQYKRKHSMKKLKKSHWYKCKICCAMFSNYYKLSKHKVEHNKPNPYECKQCMDTFGDVDSLMAHIRVHQGKDPYQCKKCDKGFMTKEELQDHVPVHILRKNPAPVKRFRCDICAKEFSKLCDMERHTRVHTGEKPCECNICHKRFQQSHNLSKHLLTHLHVKPFQCEICNKKFGRVDVLNRHLLIHSMEKPFKCDICPKGFIRQVQWTSHMTKLHPEVDVGDMLKKAGDS